MFATQVLVIFQNLNHSSSKYWL